MAASEDPQVDLAGPGDLVLRVPILDRAVRSTEVVLLRLPLVEARSTEVVLRLLEGLARLPRLQVSDDLDRLDRQDGSIRQVSTAHLSTGIAYQLILGMAITVAQEFPLMDTGSSAATALGCCLTLGSTMHLGIRRSITVGPCITTARITLASSASLGSFLELRSSYSSCG